jgi:hypothetical protein
MKRTHFDSFFAGNDFKIMKFVILDKKKSKKKGNVFSASGRIASMEDRDVLELRRRPAWICPDCFHWTN